MVKLFIRIVSILLVSILMVISVCSVQNNTPVYKSNADGGKKIALTFDDGPHPSKTKNILDILDKYDVKATFFVIGVNVKNYCSSFKDILERGHEIGNHTYNHKALNSNVKEIISEEISKTEEEIRKNGGQSTNLIRPPCGLYNEKLIKLAMQNDYKIVLWNIDTNDWAHAKSEEMTKNVLNKVKGGDIILFHDYISGISNTADALDEIIPKLIEQGYEFVTVTELLQ